MRKKNVFLLIKGKLPQEARCAQHDTVNHRIVLLRTNALGAWTRGRSAGAGCAKIEEKRSFQVNYCRRKKFSKPLHGLLTQASRVSAYEGA